MSTEDLLKRAALTERKFLATEQVSALEHDLYDSTHALAAALRESERQLAEARDMARCQAVSVADLTRHLEESERHRAHLADVVQGCAAAIAPLAEATDLRAGRGERVDALIGRVVAAASDRIDQLTEDLRTERERHYLNYQELVAANSALRSRLDKT